MGSKRYLARVVAVIAVAVLATASSALAAIGKYDATDAELVEEWLSRLQSGERAALDELLSPHFMIARGDGTYMSKAEYLDNPAVLAEYVVTNVVGNGVGDVRVVRYDLSSVEWIDGVQLTKDPIPRLSVFYWTGEQWHLIAHANFLNIRQ